MNTTITIDAQLDRETVKEIAALCGGYVTMSSPTEFTVTTPKVIDARYRFKHTRTFNHVDNDGPSAA